MKHGGLKIKIMAAICRILDTGSSEVTVAMIQQELLKDPELDPPAYMTVATMVHRLEQEDLLAKRVVNGRDRGRGGRKKHYFTPKFDLDQIFFEALKSVLNDFFSGNVEALKTAILKTWPEIMESASRGEPECR